MNNMNKDNHITTICNKTHPGNNGYIQLSNDTNQGISRTFNDHKLETPSGDQQSMTLALCVDVGDTLPGNVITVTTEEQSTCSPANRGTSMEEEEFKVNHNHQKTIMGSSASECCQQECETG